VIPAAAVGGRLRSGILSKLARGHPRLLRLLPLALRRAARLRLDRRIEPAQLRVALLLLLLLLLLLGVLAALRGGSLPGMQLQLQRHVDERLEGERQLRLRVARRRAEVRRDL
jgi:hypothetical protein